MITLIGTCHVVNLKDRVKERIQEIGPEVVGVELDRKRFERILGRRSSSGGFLSLMAFVQERIAHQYGVRAGNDMLGGIEAAQALNIPLFLIDQDADEIMASFFEALLREFFDPLHVLRKLHAFLQLSRESLFPPPPAPGWLDLLIQDFEQDPQKYEREFEAIFPLLKQVIFDRREDWMAANLRELSRDHREIAAVVGYGHLRGLQRRLPELEIHTVPLRELWEGAPAPEEGEMQRGN
ncbi:MAG: TraB/GumN family protein [Candidatus Tectomicrobia bacterium]|uniref:TraB/GumN family protein n=1 Tax=Tectimicrobiota bacterium TaxID=2528274 RepID=A0A932CR40_UNCTE|nr:TraB/GumN family protein [Candidatus Tectomicrobia bacterium]